VYEPCEHACGDHGRSSLEGTKRERVRNDEGAIRKTRVGKTIGERASNAKRVSSRTGGARQDSDDAPNARREDKGRRKMTMIDS
jgi:hypothetical protein